MTVNDLRKKTTDEKLAKRAKALIKQWKALIDNGNAPQKESKPKKEEKKEKEPSPQNNSSAPASNSQPKLFKRSAAATNDEVRVYNNVGVGYIDVDCKK